MKSTLESVREKIKGATGKDFTCCWECDEGAKIRLADVLMAIQKQELPFDDKHKALRTIAFLLWDLTADLDNQPPEVINFLNEILSNK